MGIGGKAQRNTSFFVKLYGMLNKDSDVKRAQLIKKFWDRTLNWFMNCFMIPSGGKPKTMAQIQSLMIDEFKKPNSEQKCINEIKYMNQSPNEIVWDFEQRFKNLIHRVSFQIPNAQNKESFIAKLSPHRRLQLM